MKHLEFDLDGVDIKELPTRLSFDIATARNSDFPLIKFNFKKDAGERFTKALATNLKKIKKQGRITLFVCSLDFSSPTTETEYLFNKFPELNKEWKNESMVSYFVKI